MSHPLIDQLYFTRSEFRRALEGVTDAEARQRFLPMNCLSWNVGHLAWQEQRYFLTFAQGKVLLPELNEQFAYGVPASTPSLTAMLAAWQSVTEAANPWLAGVTTETLQQSYTTPSGEWTTDFGNLLQRVIYHYWYHTGENLAIRQLLGHRDLPEYVGNIDEVAPFRPA
jgi:uncharacterized damage-inducible protein DinB